MTLPTTDMEWVSWLTQLHDSELPQLREYDSFYQGTAPLRYLHPEILRELDGRLQSVSLGWPMIAVDPLHERLELGGFRYSDDGDDVSEEPGQELDEAALGADENLRRVWADNNMSDEFPMAMLDALVMRRAFLSVGSNEDDRDTPLVTADSPLEMYADIDPRSRGVRAALRRTDEHGPLVRTPEQYATLYLPNRTVWYDRGPSGWREIGRDEHGLGMVPVAPLVNRGRLSDRYGKSELTPPLLSLSHAANKAATDMMVGAEFTAMPLRALFGIGPADLVDAQGNRQTVLQVLMGKLLTVPMPEGDPDAVKPFEWAAADLANFHGTLNQLARHAAGLLGLDPHEFGFTTDNPASAEALRAREGRLIRRAERKHVSFSSAPRLTARLIRRFQDGDWDPRAKRIELMWRDPATPTKSAAADAAVKLFTGGIVPLRQTREDIGYTAGQMRRMEAEDAKARERDPLAEIARHTAVPVPVPPVEE